MNRLQYQNKFTVSESCNRTLSLSFVSGNCTDRCPYEGANVHVCCGRSAVSKVVKREIKSVKSDLHIVRITHHVNCSRQAFAMSSISSRRMQWAINSECGLTIKHWLTSQFPLHICRHHLPYMISVLIVHATH